MTSSHDLEGSVNSWEPEYIETLYEDYKRNPDSVDERWRAFFQGFDLGLTRPSAGSNGHAEGGKEYENGEWALAQSRLERLQSRVDSLIYHYRDIGHLMAKIDPLGRRRDRHEQLELSAFDLNEDMLDMMFNADHFPWGDEDLTLREIIDALKETYCGSVGVEYMDIQDTKQRRWLQNKMEPTLNQWEIPGGQKIRVLRLLRKSFAFEKFLHTNYVGQKRFSLEGAETLIPLLDTIIEKSPLEGIDEIVMGMAHRGRLNVLANIIQKSYEEIFSEFEDNYQPGDIMGDGDVKYHKGASTDWMTYHGHKVHVSLTSNPSHLEAVDPVVLGRVRAKQRTYGDTETRSHVMPLLIHGDAAYAGQGIVAETLNLSQLAGYRVGGTIHVIINNQIGFTTLPEDARSGDYCTDVAKMIQAPIFHVNGDDPEAVIRVAEMAVEFRQKFKKDVVIDMYCYRRHGHNEGDEPSFTQPKLYEVIRSKNNVLELYSDKLIHDGVVTEEQLEDIAKEQDRQLEDAQERAKKESIKPPTRAFQAEWAGMKRRYSSKDVKTAAPKKLLLEVADAWTRYPKNFKLHRTIERLMKKRVDIIKSGKGLDWGTAEGLAIGSLLAEGTPVRLSGQDSRRGTFSHRHAFVWDMGGGEKYMPLQFIRDGQARFCAYDSALSEASVLGFDYGYSLENPDMLICWEAQFGDFCNGAQVIIDQFIASSESKWDRVSGIVLLLPHGYEGQGPEHSNAWLDRFLSLCAEENIQVCNLTTPAQLFHCLRRQVRRDFRKPLVLMTPKSLLRHPHAVSRLEEMTGGHFAEVLDDQEVAAEKVKRVVMSSGKVFYDLYEHRSDEGIDNIALIRLEQIYPFEDGDIKTVLNRYPNAKEFVWCQEEPKNRGAWGFVSPVLKERLGLDFTYVGRAAAASPAVGSLGIHKREQAEIVAAALSPSPVREVVLVG